MLGPNSPDNVCRPLISEWRSVSEVPSLAAGEVHVWLLRIDERLRSLVETSLSQAEMERANVFRFRKHQTQFVVSRGSLRFLLGQYLCQAAGDIEIHYADLGKPYLSQQFQPNVHFNISHSSEYAVLAFSHTQELGIDSERREPESIDEGLLRQCLTASEKLIYEQALPEEKTEFFFDTWARKEAYMKLLGDGLNIPPNELSLCPIRSARETEESYNVCFSPMPALQGFSSALAIRKQPSNVQFYMPGSNSVMQRVPACT